MLAILAKRPTDAKAYVLMGQIEARLGHKEEAIAAGERAVELLPIAKDAVDGPDLVGRLAGILAQTGEPSRALDVLESVARIPNVTNYGSLKLDETWDPLRQEPRFQKIVASLGPLAETER